MSARLALLVPVAFALALTLPGVAREGFTHEDEWRNAVMAREMAASGPVVHPRLHGELYPDYPPLYFWSVIPTARLQGEPTPLSLRLPSVLGAALIALATALLALRLGSARVALHAGCLVSVLPLLHIEERRAMIDPLFTGLSTLSIALLARGTWRTLPWGCLALALTWLTKGPLGAVVVGLALAGGEGLLVALVPAERRFRDLAGRAGLLAVFVLLLGWCWFSYAYATEGKAFGDNLLLQQTIGRFKDKANKQHEKPWHFYLATTLPGLLPQLGLAVSGVRRSRVALFAAGWFVLTLVFLSICNTKRTYYPMPAYPAVALLVAELFERELPSWLSALWRTALSWGLVLAAVLGVLAGFYAKEIRDHGLAIACGALLGWASLRMLVARRKPALALAAASAFVLAAVSATVSPSLARRKGQKDFAEALRGVEHIAVSPHGIHREALCFWLARPGAPGTVNIDDRPPAKRTNGADADGILRWLEKYPPGTAAVVVHRRDYEGRLNPLAPGSPLIELAQSDEEMSSDDFVAIGLRAR